MNKQPWVLSLVNRADGVDGNYCIGRWNPNGYADYWNHQHGWTAAGSVMSLDEATVLIEALRGPTEDLKRALLDVVHWGSKNINLRGPEAKQFAGFVAELERLTAEDGGIGRVVPE